MTEVFVEQPLASPGSAKYDTTFLKLLLSVLFSSLFILEGNTLLLSDTTIPILSQDFYATFIFARHFVSTILFKVIISLQYTGEKQQNIVMRYIFILQL